MLFRRKTGQFGEPRKHTGLVLVIGILWLDMLFWVACEGGPGLGCLPSRAQTQQSWGGGTVVYSANGWSLASRGLAGSGNPSEPHVQLDATCWVPCFGGVGVAAQVALTQSEPPVLRAAARLRF